MTMKLVKAVLCHGLNEDFSPIFLRSVFRSDDRYVILVTHFDEITDNRFEIMHQWLHANTRFKLESVATYKDTNQVMSYSYISPLMLQADRSIDPSGLWAIEVFFNKRPILRVHFNIEKTIDTRSYFVDERV